MKGNIIRLLRKEATLIVGIIVTIILIFIPTSYGINEVYNGTIQAKAKVIETDNSMIKIVGVIQMGEQRCLLQIESGEFEDCEYYGINLLSGSLENDKIYEVGDTALVSISVSDGNITSISMIDHYRINYEIILAIILIVLLIIFAGKTGVRAVLSFIITVLALWKILIPAYLNGNNPIIIGLFVIIALTIIIELFVFGFNKKSISAISGGVLGIISTCILGIVFTNLFKIHGAIMPNSEALLYTGYENLDLTMIYMSTIFIGSSGALMDISTDITQSMVEVVGQNPDIKFKDAMLSGFRVGKAAMGTMSTTLLLAYAGGCIALFMTFVAQGVPIMCILNYKTVAAEILDTLVGSFGLIAVAPFTAITSAFFLTKKNKKKII